MKSPFLLAMVVVIGLPGAACAGDTATPPGPSTTLARFVCPPGSTPDRPGPVDQDRPPADLLDVAGVALIVILLVHLLLHWRWVLNVTKRVLLGPPGEG